MNQSSCLRLCPVLIVRLKLMLFPSTEHLMTLASRSAVSQIAARYHLTTMSSMIFNLFESGFTARSVRYETPSSGSWICILLSCMISHVGKRGSFDSLVLFNILQRGMEHVTSNCARISYETTKQSIFTVLRLRTLFGVKHRNNGVIEFLSLAIDV